MIKYALNNCFCHFSMPMGLSEKENQSNDFMAVSGMDRMKHFSQCIAQYKATKNLLKMPSNVVKPQVRIRK